VVARGQDAARVGRPGRSRGLGGVGVREGALAPGRCAEGAAGTALTQHSPLNTQNDAVPYPYRRTS